MNHLPLLAGLVIFLGSHLFLVLARQRVDALKARLGANTWRGIHSVLALVGLGLIIYGFGLSRAAPVFLWQPPLWTPHVAALFSALAMFLLVATLVPGNHLKVKLGHPMYAAIKLWAFAHLLANGRLGDVLLFASFLAWSVIGFTRSRRRDRAQGASHGDAAWSRTLAVLAGGIVLTFAIVHSLHHILIGVPVH